MLVICKDKHRCANEECPHFTQHKEKAHISTCGKGNCHMLIPDRLVETWCIPYKEEPQWEV
jgi:hypothetical protein